MQTGFSQILLSFQCVFSGFMSKPDSGPAFACSHNAVDPTCHWMLYQEASMYSQSCPCSPVEEGQAGHSLCSGLQGSGSVWALGHLNPLHCTQRLPTVCPLSCGADGSWVNSLRKRPGCGLQGKQKGGRKRERLLQFCLFFSFTPVFSRTINWGPEDSSPQLLFFSCSSSVLFEIWCFRQRKAVSLSKENKRGGKCVWRVNNC